jgi:hypothetical protein
MSYLRIKIESISKINDIKTISNACEINELLSIINFIGLRKINL